MFINRSYAIVRTHYTDMYTSSRYAYGPGYEVYWFIVHVIEQDIIDTIRVGAFYTHFCLNGLGTGQQRQVQVIQDNCGSR